MTGPLDAELLVEWHPVWDACTLHDAPPHLGCTHLRDWSAKPDLCFAAHARDRWPLASFEPEHPRKYRAGSKEHNLLGWLPELGEYVLHKRWCDALRELLPRCQDDSSV